MSAENATESAEFRLHIRNLLYNYSLTHLTTNYLSFTEELVSEFVASLQPVALSDPYSLVLAVDPFQTFSDLHSLSLLKPYDEIPQISNEALAYLKRTINSTIGKPLTEKIVWNDSYNSICPPEPLIPALTRRSRRNTPKLGKGESEKHIRQHLKRLLDEQKFHLIPVEPVQEETLVPEEILNLKCQMQSEEAQAVRTLLKTTTDMLRAQPSYRNKYLDPSHLCNIPLFEPVSHDEFFTPIFPKSRLPGSGMKNLEGHLAELRDFVDIANTVIPSVVQVEKTDEDISLENMAIVDGWVTIKSSPPSTPSSRQSDEEDQLDQLFLQSTPNTDPPLIEEISKSRIDPILMPRSRQIGGSSGVMPHILANQTLNTFLQPLLKLSKTPTEPSSVKNDDGSDQHPHSSPIAPSALTQPPTALNHGHEDEIKSKPDIRDQDLDTELRNMYNGKGLIDMIVNETLDGQHDLLMEIPDLPPPNIHPPNDVRIPVAFSDFIPSIRSCEAKDDGDKMACQPLYAFLKKAKGRESLGLALSWVPFTVDERLPSAAELLGVTELFNENQLTGEVNQVKLGNLLNSLDFEDEGGSENRWTRFDEAWTYHPPDTSDDFHILLTRQERRRLARLEGKLEVASDLEDEHDAHGCGNTTSAHQMQEYEDVSSAAGAAVSGFSVERPVKRRRLENKASSEWVQDEACSQPLVADTSCLPEPSMCQLDSPTFSVSDDKENWPPGTSSSGILDEGYSGFYFDPKARRASLCDQEESDMLQDDAGSFEPLSFGSLQPAFRGTFSDEKLDPLRDYTDGNTATQGDHYGSVPLESSRTLTDHASQSPLETSSHLELAFDPDIAARSLGIEAFAHLRAKRITKSKNNPDIISVAPLTVDISGELRNPPQEIFDRNTICLPEVSDVAQSTHRYLASLDLIQKHALVRALRSAECAVELVERQTLDGVDLILDPHSAIIFFSVFTLPARCDSYVERVSQQSWKYSHILVIFETYPEHQSKRSYKQEHSTVPESDLYAYTPPIVKAIKKFKRDLTVADACQMKRPETLVQFAFAENAQAGALLARMYGFMAEGRDQTEGAIWDERDWLTSDISEEEEGRLAGLNGLNHFSASIILCQISLQDFVDISSEERIACFAGFIGVEVMRACNEDLDARFQALSESSEMSGTLGSDLEEIVYSE